MYEYVPGFLGASTATALISREKVWWKAIRHLLTGVIFAVFTGPALASYAHVSAPLGYYLAGLFGVAIITKTFRVIDKMDVVSILKERIK